MADYAAGKTAYHCPYCSALAPANRIADPGTEYRARPGADGCLRILLHGCTAGQDKSRNKQHH